MAGYREREHTADWELEAWAEDLPGLFEQAARGMYALAGTRLHHDRRERLVFSVQGYDDESLLVRFLSELLYLGQQSGLGFDSFELRFRPAPPGAQRVLEAAVEGAPLLSVDKEIKAVTYHNLQVRQQGNELRVNVVFDV